MKSSLKLGIVLAVIVIGVYSYSFYNSSQTTEKKKWFGVIDLNSQMEQNCENALIDLMLSDTENTQIATWIDDNCQEYLTPEKKQEIANKIQSQYLRN